MKGFYIVGGWVRDTILGKNPKDKDYIAVGYSAEELLKLGFSQVGADFPVFLHPETKDEYALPRTERSTGKGYHDFVITTEGVTLEEDLKRRDLTINAMAMIGDVIVDPYGGQDDLKNKILRHTSEAFFEDPVRVLRLARFAARYSDFKIAEETISLVKNMKDAVKEMTAERIWKETEKALSEEHPEKFFRALKTMDVLDVIFPEIFAMIDVPQNPKYHAEGDVFNHTMLVLKEVSKISKNTRTRYAALFHDIGKAKSFKETGKLNIHSSEDLVLPLLETVKERYKVPKDFHQLAVSVALLHHRMYLLKEMNSKAILNTFEHKHFPKNTETLEMFLDAVNADTFGRIIGDGDLLSEEDVDLISETNALSLIKGKKMFLPGKRIRKDLVDREKVIKTFLLLKTVSPKEILHEKPSVDKIRNWMRNKKLNLLSDF